MRSKMMDSVALAERFCSCCGQGGVRVLRLRDGRRWAACQGCELGCPYCSGILVDAVPEGLSGALCGTREAHGAAQEERTLMENLYGANMGVHEVKNDILGMLQRSQRPLAVSEVVRALAVDRRPHVAVAVGSLVYWGKVVVDRGWEHISIPALDSRRDGCVSNHSISQH